MTCSVGGCDGIVRARGWCNKHYHRWKNFGDPQALSPRAECGADGCTNTFIASKAKHGLCAYHKNRAWKKAHPEAINAGNRHYSRQNPEKVAGYARRWREQNLDKLRLKAQRQRARRAQSFVEDVHPLVVLELDDGVCGICGEDVDPFDFHVDHIVPIARGGEHSYANTQVAHPFCNVSKGARMADEYERWNRMRAKARAT